MNRRHSCKSHPNNACVACLAALASSAMREPEGPDLGPMTRAERHAHLFGSDKA